MGLPWVRLDTNIASHDKILALIERKNGHRAAFVYVCCLAYSGQNGTDGCIPFGALRFVHGLKTDMHALVEVGLLTPVPRGWQIVNYATRQQLSQVTEEIRTAQTIGGRKGACIKHHGPECGCWRKASTA